MKIFSHFLTAVLCVFMYGTASAQTWNTPDANGNMTTVTPAVKNVIVGPTPTTPTQLHLNGLQTPNLVFTLENTSSSTGVYTGIKFKGAGMPFQMYTDQFPACGAGYFHMAPITTGAGIHFTGTGIVFSSTAYGTNIPGVCGTFGSIGKYSFDGSIGATSANIGYTTNPSFPPPSGYLLTNSGKSYFADKVAIGLTSPATLPGAYKLYVGGSIICEEVVVKLQANWADYVFSPQYKLMPLTQVKSYIETNSHLPGVPAACEVAENGVATGEMLNIQMQKIEELTLYLIQMEERIKLLEAQNKALQNQSGQ